MKRLLLLVALVTSCGAFAGTLAYDPAADARADVQRALTEAKASHRPVLLIFGANWCEDCRALDAALKSGRNGALVAREFNLVKVDVGNFDRNLDVAMAYGDPIARGIPAAVIVAPDNRILFSTRAGELADARRMSITGVHDFFARAAQAAKASR
ncbi:MAG: thioredoxin family protein [Betaproteobacteria bacterium]